MRVRTTRRGRDRRSEQTFMPRPKFNLRNLQKACQDALDLLETYTEKNESRLDPLLFALLYERFGHFSRQKATGTPTATRPNQIDFRRGTTNPALVEFAVKTPHHRTEIAPSTNEPELLKLTKVPPAQARYRALVLFDVTNSPLTKSYLRKEYRKINAGPGNFRRYTVSILYVHKQKDASFRFPWKPSRTA
jgi:hypothetical protein